VTVLGTASKVYAGNVAAVAVYAGSVKVWPAAPPPPVGEPADWSFDDISGQLRLSIRGVPEPTVGLAIAVPPGPDPVPEPTDRLGQNTAVGYASVFFYNPGRRAWRILNVEWQYMTNAEAVAQFSGRTLYVTEVNPAAQFGAGIRLSFDAP
jgi:hypothetical protein